MLKYILASITISFCHLSSSGQKYTQLTFLQRSPVSAFYVYRDELVNEMYSVDQVNASSMINLIELTAMNASKWVIHGLDAFNSNGHWMMKCTNINGEYLEYRNMVPEMAFLHELKSYWPCFYSGVKHEQNWAAIYDYSGSCVSTTPRAYFQTAMELSILYNMGDVLRNSGIELGSSHLLQHIINAIMQYLGFRPSLKCLQAQDPEQQYLLEVRLCFNRERELSHCIHNLPDDCDESKKIIYRDWPPTEY